jgi:hypothetical protein
MRDQIDAEIWNTHHDQFSEWLSGALTAAGQAIRRGFSRVPAAPQLIAAAMAGSFALLTVGATIA